MLETLTAKQIIEEAELQNTKWGGIIIEAEKRGFFTGPEKDLAFDWKTCPCGELSSLIEKDDGDPKDNIIASLGCGFYTQLETTRVSRQLYFHWIARTFVAIKERERELLKRL